MVSLYPIKKRSRSFLLKMEPRPFLWLRITRPMAVHCKDQYLFGNIDRKEDNGGAYHCKFVVLEIEKLLIFQSQDPELCASAKS